jgi:hypothetical protein
VLKLAAVLTMVGVMVGTLVVPQNQLLSDAGATMCGNRSGPVALLSRDRSSPPSCVRRRLSQLGVGCGQVRLSALCRPDRRRRQLVRVEAA